MSDFMQFIEDLSKDKEGIRKAFRDEITSNGLSVANLEVFFQNKYSSITREECEKIFAAINASGKGKAGDIVLQY